jgi:pimeloyl-ACP methyl ester carboxylesterase
VQQAAHVVGLSYGASVVIAILARHPDRIDRAVVDGGAVLPTWGGWGDRFVQLGVTAVSPIINARPVVALLGRIGLREVGVELGAASPRAFRRAYREGSRLPSHVPCYGRPARRFSWLAAARAPSVRPMWASPPSCRTRSLASYLDSDTRGSGFGASCTST